MDECSLLYLICGILVTDEISLGICAMDYRGEDLYPSANTPGLIVDDVSRREQQLINLPIRPV